jgi:hypothetical protein
MHQGLVGTNYKLRRSLVRCRRVLFDVYALPEGTLPPEMDEAIEDLLMPGYRERLLRRYLASLPTDHARPA